MIEHVFLYSSRIALSVLASSNAVVLGGVDEDEYDKHTYYITVCKSKHMVADSVLVSTILNYIQASRQHL